MHPQVGGNYNDLQWHMCKIVLLLKHVQRYEIGFIAYQ